MFKFQGKFHKYKLSFDIESVIAPYWELVISLNPDYIESKKLYTIDSNFEKDYLARKQDFGGTDDSVFYEETKQKLRSLIADKLLTSILNKTNLDHAISKVALFCFTLNQSYYIVGDTEYNLLRGKLIYMFHTNKLLEKFFQIIGISGDNCFLTNANAYEAIIPKEEDCEVSDMDSLFYPLQIIKVESLEKSEDSDFEMTWRNDQMLSNIIGFESLENQTFTPLFQKDELLAIQIGTKGILPVQRLSDRNLISDIKTKLWMDIKSLVYFKGESSKDRRNRKVKNEEQKFLDKAKQDDLTNLLSRLKYNLYLRQPSVQDFEDFFVSLTLSENVKGLQNFQFLTINSQEEGPFFAAYQNVKDYSDNDYNLRHYAEYVGNNKIKISIGDKPVGSQERNIVSALKPQYAFYYLSYYYEDFFKMVLEELKENFNDLDFITNYKIEIEQKQYEVDVIVYYRGQIYFIELKTNLGFENINDFRNKCLDIYDSMPELKEDMHFYIIGAYAKREVDMLNKDEDMLGYNEKRAGLDGIPYAFCIPINSESELHGFCESSYEHLKQTLIKIFKLKK